MKTKNRRMEVLKALIASRQLGSQEDVLQALRSEGYKLTQATLSRDLKQLKVAKAATTDGRYVYVLPTDTMYRRVGTGSAIAGSSAALSAGFVSIDFAGNMGVIKTRPGYASSIAYNIDNANIPFIIGTIAGDDTIFIVLKSGTTETEVKEALAAIIPDIF